MENNKMFSFNGIIDNCFKDYDVYIPLIQRNYKWDMATAAKLAVDLWKAFKEDQKTYTVGMITLYKESEKMQLIDGQQRITTLLMLLKYIEPNEEHFTFRFERDEGISEGQSTRQSYLKNIACPKNEEVAMYTDTIRFEDNYQAIKEVLQKEDYKEECATNFSKYIKENTYFLLHLSEAEPFDEFINLNKNKTRFVISDRIKANLVIDAKAKIQEEKEDVLNLFRKLSALLFSEKDLWQLVQQGYFEKNIPEGNENRYKNKYYPDENRLKLLCCERYGSDDFDQSSTLGYEYENELKVLKEYERLLSNLVADITSGNWNSYNAYNCLYQLNSEVHFFEMIKESNKGELEEYILKEYESLGAFEKSCFVESQLKTEKDSLDFIKNNITIIQKEFNKDHLDTDWIISGDEEFEKFKQIYLNYIAEKYKQYAEV